jgi:hypothetical protein
MKIFKDISFNTSWKDFLFDLSVSEDRFKFEQDFFRGDTHKYIVSRAIGDFLGNRENNFPYQKLEEILAKSKANRVAILDAHGDCENGVWYYHETKEDGDFWGTDPYITRRWTINSWIKKQEKKNYGALILHCCNPENNKPIPIKTPIFYAEGDIGIFSEYRSRLLEPPNQ